MKDLKIENGKGRMENEDRRKENGVFLKNMSFFFLLIAFSLFSFFLSPSNAQSLEFRKDSTWANVLVEAKRQHKPIFLDVYTTWCKPCKQLENEVFSLTSVGEKLNSSFICYRIDAEKGEGIAIASSYQVQSYPALFFFRYKRQ